MHAVVGEVGKGPGAASGGGDLLGRYAPSQQRFDGEAAKVAGGSCDNDGHEGAPGWEVRHRWAPGWDGQNE